MEGSHKVYVKTEPMDDSFFIKLPSNLAHYVYISGYKAEMNYLYALIVDHFSVEKGFAYPSQLRLARLYGKDLKTLRNHLRKLREVKLIDYEEEAPTKVYVPLVPLTQEELWAQAPEAERRYKDVVKKESDERMRGAENWARSKWYR
ncbi:DNA-binding transcriptional ArsR family regulator [Alkalihalobacillus xiaoxiensis]|uniref:DNA-binding transcriptional ArsR family regulator n=1 Tax=Shouchella xiaoxiensis TaxID=766895 RepID=A0ABS2SS61_9BACI|nr:hypothetical protein [Shouchella xiaoxiensis]MBM7838345.1 DNA-binding transcriptional ArsR family regulator [Shouchella xiaoxiensis]